jgi:DNA polymerase III delta prime subunit
MPYDRDMSLYSQLWVEKYRPHKLEDLVLSKENRKFFSEIDSDTPHILLYGNAGTGKTTLAKILVKDILKCQYLYINASDENGIDTIRNKVTSFAQTSSLDGKRKIIILDEFCGTTAEAQRILRSVMEEYAENTRFILTANYISRIIEPLQSRCLLFKIQPTLNDMVERCCIILKKENIKVGEDEKIKLLDHINKNYPDMRRVINDLQRFSVTGSLNIVQVDQVKNVTTKLFNDLVARIPSVSIRKSIIEEEKSFGGDYHLLMKDLMDLFYDSNIKEDKKKRVMLEIGEHMYRDNFVVDHEINFFCCIMAIENALLS